MYLNANKKYNKMPQVNIKYLNLKQYQIETEKAYIQKVTYTCMTNISKHILYRAVRGEENHINQAF